jgi:hypothetical protein
MGRSSVDRKIGEREIKEGQVIARVYDKESLYEMTELNMELR